MRRVALLDEDDRIALFHKIDTMLTKQQIKELIVGREAAR